MGNISKIVCTVNGFEWIEQLFEFDERFIKNYDENNDKGVLLK